MLPTEDEHTPVVMDRSYRNGGDDWVTQPVHYRTSESYLSEEQGYRTLLSWNSVSMTSEERIQEKIDRALAVDSEDPERRIEPLEDAVSSGEGLESDDGVGLTALALSHIGVSQFNVGNFDKAKEMHSRAIRQAKGADSWIAEEALASAQNGLGTVYAAEERTDQALEWFNSAVDSAVDSESPGAFNRGAVAAFNLGEVLTQTDDDAEAALEAYQQMLSLAEDIFSVHDTGEGKRFGWETTTEFEAITAVKESIPSVANLGSEIEEERLRSLVDRLLEFGKSHSTGEDFDAFNISFLKALGLKFISKGELDDAESLLREAAEEGENANTDEGRGEAREASKRLAELLRDQGRDEEAIEFQDPYPIIDKAEEKMDRALAVEEPEPAQAAIDIYKQLATNQIVQADTKLSTWVVLRLGTAMIFVAHWKDEPVRAMELAISTLESSLKTWPEGEPDSIPSEIHANIAVAHEMLYGHTGDSTYLTQARERGQEAKRIAAEAGDEEMQREAGELLARLG